VLEVEDPREMDERQGPATDRHDLVALDRLNVVGLYHQ